ncbi:MAG: PH domain-containing protein [Bdellovibrionales bacterium]|nr:PH domain-containing protein [Bdellovibrionales bacterium]
MLKGAIIIPRVWRAELQSVVTFFVCCALAIFLSVRFPGSVIPGKLFSIGSYSVNLTLPLWSFLPLFPLFNSIYRIYNVRYIVDSRGIEARTGILALRQRITRVRYEDIRSVETEQTLLDRMLDIGQVEIGTAATGSIEILFMGVGAPAEVQDMIQRERDRRHKIARQAPQHQPTSSGSPQSARA